MPYRTVTVFNKRFPFTDVQASPFNADNTGVVGCSAALEQIKAYFANKGPIYFSEGTYLIDADLTIPVGMQPIIPKGTVLKIATGKTLTMPVPDAGLYQIFDCQGTGRVEFSRGKEAYPEWWGAVADNGLTDCTSAVQAVADSKIEVIIGCIDAYYEINDTITVKTANQKWASGYFKQATPAKYGFYVTADGVGFGKDIHIEGYQHAVYNQYEYGIWFEGTNLNTRISGKVIGSKVHGWGGGGIYGHYVDDFQILQTNVYDCVYCGIQGREADNVTFAFNTVKNIGPGTGGGLACGLMATSEETGGTPTKVTIALNNTENVLYQAIICEPAQDLLIIGNNMVDSRMFIGVSHLAATANDLLSSRVKISNNIGINKAAYYVDPTNRLYGIGVHGYSDTYRVTNVTVENNQLTNAGGIVNGSIYGAFYFRQITSLKVTGNKAYNSYLAGIHCYINVLDFDISGNIVDTLDGVNDVGGIFLHSTGIIDGVITGNKIYNMSEPVVYASAATTNVQIGKNYNLAGGNLINAYSLVQAQDHVNYTAVSTSGTGEQNLITYTIKQNTMPTNGCLSFSMAGTKTNVNGDKTIKLYLGSSSVTVHPAVNDTRDWLVQGDIILPGSATAQRVTWQCIVGDAGAVSGWESWIEDLSAGDVILKLTGECAHASDIITQHTLRINR